MSYKFVRGDRFVQVYESVGQLPQVTFPKKSKVHDGSIVRQDAFQAVSRKKTTAFHVCSKQEALAACDAVKNTYFYVHTYTVLPANLPYGIYGTNNTRSSLRLVCGDRSLDSYGPVKTKLSGIQIRQAEPGDLEKLFRFRYEVYVEEMGRPQRYADHRHRRIEEPLDATATQFLALKQDRIVGCVRWNGGDHAELGEYVHLYRMKQAGRYFPNRCSITTKLMTAPEYRRSKLGVDICVAAFEFAVDQGVICDFIDCNPHLEHLFTRFGYRSYCGRINHPEYGDVLPMLLLFVDHDHLARLRSPFAASSQAARDPNALSYFRNNVFSQHTHHPICHATAKETPELSPILTAA